MLFCIVMHLLRINQLTWRPNLNGYLPVSNATLELRIDYKSIYLKCFIIIFQFINYYFYKITNITIDMENSIYIDQHQQN